jgi:hypothetical protein
MHVRTVRKPGDAGTQKLVAKFGDRLVAVRYCYDPAKGKRYKTVELIVTEEDWRPPEPRAETAMPEPKPKSRRVPRVPVRIQYFEKDLQRRVRTAGGLWDPKRKLWYAPEETVRQLGLVGRVVR